MDYCNPCEVHVTTRGGFVIEYLYEWPHGGQSKCAKDAATHAESQGLKCVWVSMCRLLGKAKRKA